MVQLWKELVEIESEAESEVSILIVHDQCAKDSESIEMALPAKCETCLKQDTLRGRAFRCRYSDLGTMSFTPAEEVRDGGTALGVMHLDCTLSTC